MVYDDNFKRRINKFFLEYKEQNPLILMILMVCSLGLYLFIWLFLTNKELEKIDEDSPDPKRAVVILFVLPSMVITIMHFLSIIFSSWMADKMIFAFGTLIWALVIFLSLQYIYDFCNSFGKFTQSSGLIWYLFLYPGYFSLILIFFNFFWTLFFVLFPIFTILAMQDVLIKKCQSVKLKNYSDDFELGGRTIIK